MHFRARLKLIPIIALASCATLNTAGMTPACQGLYNVCLNKCPQPKSDPKLPDFWGGWKTSACVEKCNGDAHLCK